MMSVSALAWASRQQTGNGIATAVLRFLAWRWNDAVDPACSVRLTTIIDETEFSRAAVIRAVKLLEAMNLLHTERVKTRNGLANSYILHCTGEGENAEPDKVSDPVPILVSNPVPNSVSDSVPPNIERNKNKNVCKNNILSSPPDGVTEESWEAWRVICKAKRLWPKTRYSWKRCLSQMTKAGLTAQQGVDFCIERGWASFVMGWYLNAQKTSKNAHFIAAKAQEEEPEAILDLFRSRP